MESLTSSFRHCLSGLANFTGRDAPRQYWPYVLTLVIIQIILGMAITLPMMVAGMREAFSAISAEQAAGQMADPAAVQARIMQSMIADMQATLPWTMAIQILFCLLIAAATVRRLHDRDWSGWWVLVGVAAMAVGVIGGQWSMAVFADDPMAAIDNMGMIQAVGWAPWIGYAILLVQLVQRGTPGDNRFGPPPA